jgi:hypothetical protein
MLAVMKAVDAGQDATFNLGGEPITLEYPEARFLAGKYKAFLKAGRQEEFLKYMENPMAFDRLMKQLRDLMDKQKNFKGSVQGERGIEEGSGDPEITPGTKTQYGTVMSVKGNTVTVKASNGELTTVNIHDIQQGVAENMQSLPAVNENEYWCKIDSTAKPIPEGYKRTANGYITRA